MALRAESWQVSSRPFSWARSASVLIVWSKPPCKSNSTLSISSRPASILEKSRMSLMMVSSESADDFTMLRYSCCSE